MDTTALALRLDPRTAPSELETAQAAARFEALLLEQMMKPLTESKLAPAWATGGAGGRLARELHVSELARIAAERGALGLPRLFEPGAAAGAETAEETTR
ncbi:MAG: hypothetical protein DCC71_20680 [Proteobacteria bacterium]|nr:MAG: hypothetical protein DCC71_20680 [Pseudomonadota bacterium]